jgi:hypothetical protein
VPDGTALISGKYPRNLPDKQLIGVSLDIQLAFCESRGEKDGAYFMRS